jgi:hypothetical protein
MRSISSSKTSGGKIPSCMWVQNNYPPASESTYSHFADDYATRSIGGEAERPLSIRVPREGVVCRLTRYCRSHGGQPSGYAPRRSCYVLLMLPK